MTRLIRSFLTLAALVAMPMLDLAAQAPAAAEEEFGKAVYFGRKFADLGEHASAYEQFAKADAIHPDQPAVLYNMAVVLARAGRYAEAQVKADRYRQLFPEGAEAPLIGRLQLELEFQREFQKKRQADQEYADIFNRGRFLYGGGDLEGALALFTQAEQLRPDDAGAVFNQAVIFEKRGDLTRAIERFRRYGELERDQASQSAASERVFALQREVEEMRTRIVCSFCGHKLPAGATWCERCWHGPYDVKSPAWNARTCADGATATRATYFSDERFNRNDVLPCLFAGGTMLESLRYSPARQRAIQDARKAEGWSYDGEVLEGWRDRQGNQIRFLQGSDRLEAVTSSIGGEILTYDAHEVSKGIWLLDREDLVVDGKRYTNFYTFDGAGHIVQQRVEYQNEAACDHLIAITANYAYEKDLLRSVTLNGGYEGFAVEGSPKTEWNATIAYSYDEAMRLSREELVVTSFNKTYMQRAQGEMRDEIARIYPTMRVKRPLETVLRQGDLCATSGNLLLANPIDLRPFYVLTPNLATTLQNGVTKAVVTFTYGN